jgi:hypothetical protein
MEIKGDCRLCVLETSALITPNYGVIANTNHQPSAPPTAAMAMTIHEIINKTRDFSSRPRSLTHLARERNKKAIEDSKRRWMTELCI